MCDGCGELTETSRTYGMSLCEGCRDLYDRSERDFDQDGSEDEPDESNGAGQDN